MTLPRAFAILPAALVGIALIWSYDPSTSPQETSRPQEVEANQPDAAPTLATAWSGMVKPSAGDRLDPEVFEAFNQWARNTAEAEADISPDSLEEGIRLATRRRSALKQLIQNDPEASLAAAVPWSLRQELPPVITSLLEDRISAPAEFSVLAAVPQEGESLSEPSIRRTAIIEGNIFQVYVYGGREAIDSKQNLPLDGIAIDNQLAVLDTSLRPLEEGEAVNGDVLPMISADHQAGEGTGAPKLWISGGRSYELCCDHHASSLAAELAADELTPGPALGASGGGVSSTPGVPVGASAWTEGTKSLLVIRVDFSDLTGVPQDSSGTPIDASFLLQRINNEVAGWIEEVSYSKGSMTLNPADVTAVLRMPKTGATYANGGLNNTLRLDALEAATTAGFTPSNYDRVALVFNDLDTNAFPSSQITYGGLGQIGDSFTWYNGSFSFGIFAHEFGHNYGLRHANLWQIPSGSNPVDPAGSSTEYGDVFDLMGSSPSNPDNNNDHFNPWFLNRLNWLADSSVETITTSGTYRVHRYDHQNANAANKLALKVARSAEENYWIGYRRKYESHFSHSDIRDGAYFVWGYDYQRTSNLIDIDTPGSDPMDASLDVGDTFDDVAAGIEFTVTAAGGSGSDEYLDIDITFDPRISFSQSSYEVDEASGNLAVVLSRDNNANGAVSVTLSTSDGTADSPADFTATSVPVSWADGDDSPKTVNIPIVADSTIEGSETFTLTLSGISGGVLPNVSTVTASILEPGASDPGFAHGFFNNSTSVWRMALQPNRQIAFAGRASFIDGVQVDGVGRFDPDGTLDEAFSTASTSNFTPVYDIVRQPDGKTLIAGNFTSISGVARTRIARLNEDGSLDTSFDPGVGPNDYVIALALRPDGRILIAGDFTSVAGVARRGLAQLMPDGTLDPSFLATPLSNFVAFAPECLALQPDGKLLVGGLSYTDYNALFSNFSSGMLRLDESGAIDMTFDIGSGAHASGSVGSIRTVDSIAIQADGKIIVGGAFTAFDGVNSGRLARLSSEGTVDTTFATATSGGANDLIQTVSVQGDGKILVGGKFDSMSGTSRARVARLNSTGALDTTFDAGVPLTFGSGNTNDCYQLLMQPDTRILIALDAYQGGQTGVMRVFSAQSAPTGQVEFVSGSTTVNEGGTATLSVRRIGGSLGPISISYATIPSTATSADFTSKTGTLTWADGDATDKLITIDTTSDATVEPDETLTVQLGTPIGGTSLSYLGSASVTINDLMPIEAWRLANFGSSENSGMGADDADYDLDQISNLMEYALGRSPASISDGRQGLPSATLDASNPLLTGRLTLVCDIPDPAPADVDYLVEVSGSLAVGDWTTLATKSGTGPWVWQPGGTARIIETSADGRTTVEVGDFDLQSSHDRRFIRFDVSRP
ncbi:Calx-beta domain-containing protein [Haloferula sp.]|uniref:Calx-beta domain-containing protein n=1 Tax=Haloferula sp. TaxID=2497595 RepID=UPI00329E4D98